MRLFDRLFLFAWIGALAASAVPSVLAANDADNPHIKRIVPAKRLSAPPTIDGDLSDPVWQEAAAGTGFTDQKDFRPVPHQTTFWIGYDDHAVYLSTRAEHPEPDKLLKRETKRDGAIWNDDHIELRLDPYHTHRYDDFSIFYVNPIGTQASEIGGGRSDKTEWKGQWKAGAKIDDAGWTAEMAIPWAILSYPNAKEPTTLGFNVIRRHGREQYRSWFSNIGESWRGDWEGDWEGVQLPAGAFKPELLALPFIAAGAAERSGDWTQTARGGLDLRYRPTSQLTALVTLNPDFTNVQGQVEGIDFSRGERYVGESRPFFREGGDSFDTWSGAGDYFYSRRIENIDVGTKFFGKLAKRTNVGFLGAYDFADHEGDPWRVQRKDYLASFHQGFGEWGGVSGLTAVKRSPRDDNTVFGYRAQARIRQTLHVNVRYGSSWREGTTEDSDPAPLDQQERETLRGDVGSLDVGLSSGSLYGNVILGFISPDFRANNGFIEFPGRRNADFFLGAWNEYRNKFVRGAGFEFWGRYEERFDRGAGYEQFDSMLNRAFSEIGDRETNPNFFRDNIGYWSRIQTRGNWWVMHSTNWGHFREDGAPIPDFDWASNVGGGIESADRKRGIVVRYSFGQADDARRHYIQTETRWQWSKFSLNARGSALRHRERKQQHILGLNYDLTKAITVGGRVVFVRDERTNTNRWNPYLSFRRSGEAGLETFLILGDPSGDKFIPRLEGKILYPL